MIPLFTIAVMTTAHQIVPGIFSPSFFRNDVIDRHGYTSPTAILALVLIPLQYVFPGKNDVISSNPHILFKLHDTGKRKHRAWRMDKFPILLNDLNLTEIDETDGSLGRTD